MRIEFLGTGGAGTTPRPLCDCRVCVEARTKGVPYSRSGPSVFVHGPDLLIDTPEEIKSQLNRSQVTRVAAVTYSHWHPDHTAGRRARGDEHRLARVAAGAALNDRALPTCAGRG
jgi:phosphoribosyl 1,2-cyclic phosphate phosphodiesterase